MRVVQNIYTVAAPADEPLANYERTELGNWRMPAEAELGDPWIRLLLVGPKRPVVIDVAVFVEGKTFREAREAWIDDMLATPESPTSSAKANEAEVPSGNKAAEPVGTDSQVGASNATEVAAPSNETSDEKAEDTTEEKTETADETTEKEAENADAKSDKEELKLPGVAAQSRSAPSMRKRLANYLAASGTKVDRAEIGWLIAEWGSGPGLIVLDPALSWQRAGVATLEALLDGDADGALSASEISQAEAKLKGADFDANEVVEVSEIRSANRHEPVLPFAMGHSLVVILDANTDWESLVATLANVYGTMASERPSPADVSTAIVERIARGDKSLNAVELHRLSDVEADLSLRADFGSTEKTPSRLSAISARPEISDAKDAVTATENVVVVDLGSDYLEISAADGRGNANSSANESQIAVGAVIDGNPLLRLLDGDQDQRLTQRERHELAGLLASLDRDADGALSAAETPMPIRLAITLGPHVHELLVRPTSAARTIPTRDDPAPPEWFASMDKNSDSDLSREEFLGTTEQFQQFDADGDGLLNVAEALKLNGSQ